MENCNVKMIAGCTVYSYEVACPTKQAPVTSRKKAPAKKKEMSFFAQLFLMILMPFAFCIDVCTACVRSAFRFVMSHRMPARIIGSLSSFVILTTVLLVL